MYNTNCATCTAKPSGNCLSCNGGYYIASNGQSCVISCPAGEFVNSVGTACVTACPSGIIYIKFIFIYID